MGKTPRPEGPVSDNCRKRIEEAENQWKERITATEVAVYEVPAAMCEASRALLSGTTAQTVEKLTGLTHR